MSLYAKEIYDGLTNETAATYITKEPLSTRLRLLMIDRARNLAAWTAPHAGVLKTNVKKDREAAEWMREEQRRLERALDETVEVVRIEEANR
jgi:hypothetical protein